MLFRQLFEPETSTYTYLLADEVTREAVIIDPVHETVDRDARLIDELGLHLRCILETHVHADHVTGAAVLRERYGAQTAVARRAGAGCADVLVDDGDVIRVGGLAIAARATPGHTDACITWVVEDGDEIHAFTGDALLIRGCGRTDFQQGDPHALYRSIHEKIFTLPDETWVHPAHDYQGRTVSTVGEERRFNPRLGGNRSEEDFVALMSALKLAPPKKIAESVPANLRCGRAPQEAGAPR